MRLEIYVHNQGNVTSHMQISDLQELFAVGQRFRVYLASFTMPGVKEPNEGESMSLQSEKPLNLYKPPIRLLLVPLTHLQYLSLEMMELHSLLLPFLAPLLQVQPSHHCIKKETRGVYQRSFG